VRKAEDVVTPGEVVEVVVLGVNAAEKRVSLGLKQALGDPWADAEQQFRPGTVVEGQVTSLQKFGAFVQVSEGVEGMIHVGDLTSEKRINHPQEVLKMGQTVRAVVLEVDKGRRRLRLGMKQLQPTSLDEYIAEHKEGDVVTGRIFDLSRSRAKVELGEGVNATCTISTSEEPQEAGVNQSRADLESLTSMLSSKWKGGGTTGNDRREQARSGQIRSFRIVRLDPAEKKIEIELVS
jgi:small subunit ribosomal protein S1